ncbi:hypothetical protein JCM8547_001262 [Rhodosporidiobolus lusitaniae]
MFLSLPTELVQHTVRLSLPQDITSDTCADWQSTFQTLRLVSRKLRDIAQPILDETQWYARQGCVWNEEAKERLMQKASNLKFLVFSSSNENSDEIIAFLPRFNALTELRLSLVETNVSALSNLSNLRTLAFDDVCIPRGPPCVLGAVQTWRLTTNKLRAEQQAVLSLDLLEQLACLALIQPSSIYPWSDLIPATCTVLADFWHDRQLAESVQGSSPFLHCRANCVKGRNVVGMDGLITSVLKLDPSIHFVGFEEDYGATVIPRAFLVHTKERKAKIEAEQAAEQQ